MNVWGGPDWLWGDPGNASWGRPDLPSVVLWFDWCSRRWPHPQDASVVWAVDWFWGKVWRSWAVRGVYLGKPPPLLPWDYLTVRVGYDLSWYADPVTGQRPGGLCPGVDLTKPRSIFNPWHRPTVYVDSDNGTFGSALAACKTALAEVGHAAGLGERDAHDTESPAWLGKFAAGMREAGRQLRAV